MGGARRRAGAPTTGGARNAEAGRGERGVERRQRRPRRSLPPAVAQFSGGRRARRRRFEGRIEGPVVARWIGAVGRREIGRRGGGACARAPTWRGAPLAVAAQRPTHATCDEIDFGDAVGRGRPTALAPAARRNGLPRGGRSRNCAASEIADPPPEPCCATTSPSSTPSSRRSATVARAAGAGVALRAAALRERRNELHGYSTGCSAWRRARRRRGARRRGCSPRRAARTAPRSRARGRPRRLRVALGRRRRRRAARRVPRLLAAVAEHVLAGASGREAFALLLRPQLRALEQPSRGVQQGGALALREVAKALGDAQLRYGVAALAGAARRQLGARARPRQARAPRDARRPPRPRRGADPQSARGEGRRRRRRRVVVAGRGRDGTRAPPTTGASGARRWRRCARSRRRSARRGAPVAVTADQRLRLDSALDVLRYDRVSVVRRPPARRTSRRRGRGSERPRLRRAPLRASQRPPRADAPQPAATAAEGGTARCPTGRRYAAALGRGGGGAVAADLLHLRGGAAPPGKTGRQRLWRRGGGDREDAEGERRYLYATVADTRAAVHWSADRRLGAAEAAVAALAAARRARHGPRRPCRSVRRARPCRRRRTAHRRRGRGRR